MSGILKSQQRRLPRWSVAIAATLLLAAAGAVLAERIARTPVRLGFVGSLSGRNAELGQEGRDGAILAIEECDESGGINGRPVQLFVRDDHQDRQSLAKAMDELDRKQVAAIIGPMTSVTATWALDLARQHQIVLLSPTASSNRLSGLDDEFFRIYPACGETMDHLARYVVEKRGMGDVVVVLDVSNQAYTASCVATFGTSLKAHGGKVLATIEFASGEKVEFLALARQAVAANPRCILVLANAADTAMFCQQLRKLNSQIPVCSSEWAATQDILGYGGAAVEGNFFFHTFDRNYPAERYRMFRQRFHKRFGYEPGFAAVHSYDCARILLLALSEDARRETMKQKLLETRSFEGLQGRIGFDDTGDVQRELFLMCVRDGAFHSIE